MDIDNYPDPEYFCRSCGIELEFGDICGQCKHKESVFHLWQAESATQETKLSFEDWYEQLRGWDWD